MGRSRRRRWWQTSHTAVGTVIPKSALVVCGLRTSIVAEGVTGKVARICAQAAIFGVQHWRRRRARRRRRGRGRRRRGRGRGRRRWWWGRHERGRGRRRRGRGRHRRRRRGRGWGRRGRGRRRGWQLWRKRRRRQQQRRRVWWRLVWHEVCDDVRRAAPLVLARCTRHAARVRARIDVGLAIKVAVPSVSWVVRAAVRSPAAAASRARTARRVTHPA